MTESASRKADPWQTGLDALFRARSVALVGISADSTKLTGAPLRNILKNGFTGDIYLVNPRHSEISGIACYPSIEALPVAPEVALIMLPAPACPDALRALGSKGTRAAVVLSSGFEESEHGAGLADELRRAASEWSMTVIGPNCEGLWSVTSRLILTFGSAANREVLYHAPVGIISQSGAIAGGISRQLQDSGFGCAYVVSVGNETCIDALDVMEWMIEQDDVHVILLFIEGLKRGGRLVPLAARARARDIRLAALKSGNSSIGAAAASSHTGKIASPYAIYRDVFRQAGIVQLDGLSELIEAAEVLSSCPLPKIVDADTAGVAIASIPGGTRALTVDLCERRDVPLAIFDPATEAALSAILPEFSYVKNPTDLTGQAVSKPQLFDATLQIVADDPGCEAMIVQLANRGPSDLRQRKAEIAELAHTRSIPLIISLLGDALPSAERRDLLRSGIVPARDPVDAVKYLDWLYTARRGGQDTAPSSPIGPLDVADDWPSLLALLTALGIGVPTSVVVRNADDLAAAAQLPEPLVVKALPNQADHKTEYGLVLLGVQRIELAAAVAQIRERLGDPGAAVLVQETVSGVEAVLSLLVDEDFGPILAIGSGGTALEIWEDLRYVAAPAAEDQIRRVLDELKLGRLLAGFRGRPSADREALIGAVLRLSDLAASFGAASPEIEINPLFIGDSGAGVIAADILLKQPRDKAEMAQ